MPQSSPSSPAPVSGRHGRSDGMVTRQHLMDVAGLLIAERGFDATTSKQICEAAGVNMASINYHFGSREALYAELLVQAHRHWIGLDLLRAIAETPGDARFRLCRAIDAFVQASCREHGWHLPLLMRALIMPSPLLDPLIEQEILPKRTIMWRLIAEAAGLPESDPRVPACLLSIMGPILMLFLIHRQTMRRVIRDFQGEEAALSAHFRHWALAGLDALQHAPAAAGPDTGVSA